MWVADLGKGMEHRAWSTGFKNRGQKSEVRGRERQTIDGRRQMTDGRRQQTARSGQLICHMDSASLGHYAPLSLGIEHRAIWDFELRTADLGIRKRENEGTRELGN